ncbi:MarR family winged helix-turn-helix transcriptional regulator [Sphingomonas sp. AR_OL41]|uniref:MarR family winged helix-turn-helix transcriptional regulator n=1 Tax=Parasphingomonas halimpatiens TaxID=3096162 RepID=UPI0024815725|nr:MarR family winged helix-turn-helix transcriptional regulator [Sphingomonas sp. AR_OL41]MDH7974183.1 MarR family winged helix-turn-helix transcriptional regulator [Sphingomonas sp. AR_OL41]
MDDTTSDDVTGISLGRLGSFLGFRLRRVQNQLSRDFSAKTRDWGMRAGMFSALEIIASNPGVSQAVLSEEVGLDKSAVVPLVDDLERRGWVTRTRSTTDRRRNHLDITDAGKIELDRLFEHLSVTEKAGLAMLDDEERAIVSRALDKVYHAYVRPGSR